MNSIIGVALMSTHWVRDHRAGVEQDCKVLPLTEPPLPLQDAVQRLLETHRRLSCTHIPFTKSLTVRQLPSVSNRKCQSDRPPQTDTALTLHSPACFGCGTLEGSRGARQQGPSHTHTPTHTPTRTTHKYRVCVVYLQCSCRNSSLEPLFGFVILLHTQA